MTPLNSDQKQSVIERVSFMQVELSDLAKYKNIDWPTYSNERETRRNVERIIENIANSVIDVCKITLAGETTEIPGTYQDIVLKLGEIKIISKDLVSQLASLTKARNVLAHQYLDIKWDLIKDLVKQMPIFIPEFIKALNL
ncbi:hypothetical protein A3J90_03635 [candidate division WOR-1 bacterium RIFOXYC2_FULL_37_10]|uniref:DUF86 domain-containing protein n=1 Tax=candidate division WOR-1 bacterium RIFOXYB2_FULL_37_13 TaxID=1802579 RepID=A0A1F4SE95_UNCSA|nr:MAG: hypothetical protein A2246_01400 [candidate division WOR-1 bacterium RIFOXYA2_FULL_37_7]OGC18755.1 MAG: hypothetical protein A2310_02565 [candidate division WOR-1 bacterium RIFOXYB2_FULL_37_13]OGC32656.1 MAG: hypothetical protein A3J90_03635 [candidate division WOR-1 bacterium RIFOXYC2_FULL_37_10]